MIYKTVEYVYSRTLDYHKCFSLFHFSFYIVSLIEVTRNVYKTNMNISVKNGSMAELSCPIDIVLTRKVGLHNQGVLTKKSTLFLCQTI